MIFESENDTVTLGHVRITRLNDGHVPFDPHQVVSNGPLEEATEAIDALEEGKDRHRCFRVTCLLIQDGQRTILVDTGWGRWPFAARFPDSDGLVADLARRGLAPEDIDLVVTSHAHPDHIGGNVVETPEGVLLPRFGNARYRLHAADWAYYTAPERLEGSKYFSYNLPPLEQAGVLDLFDAETEVAPGIRVLPAPGHSPGNCVITIAAGNEMAVYLGDVAHHPVHLEHPEWNALFDVLPPLARETRGWLYDRLAREQPWIIGCHFVSPGIGKLERTDAGYRWREWGTPGLTG